MPYKESALGQIYLLKYDLSYQNIFGKIDYNCFVICQGQFQIVRGSARLDFQNLLSLVQHLNGCVKILGVKIKPCRVCIH
ncbi:hypothetical protein FGO68_gene8157 [Halteria grandinella]|uniref:Uncharacterized protein n=1 Tax=Halteria grandinella TaxID=5974 RepID=A0A8J8NE79_HALGN|nr:hypothetical protein FGO68_gene8157 [Halteria grandinella]